MLSGGNCWLEKYYEGRAMKDTSVEDNYELLWTWWTQNLSYKATLTEPSARGDWAVDKLYNY